MAYVAVRGKDGQEGIGSAFHVGDGVFVTARHVVEEKAIREIATFARTHVPLEGEAAKKSLVTVPAATRKSRSIPWSRRCSS
jgi:S1-C subfamily serine protease